MTRNKKDSRILSEVREAVKDLHDAGAVDIATMREFDALCPPEVAAHSLFSDYVEARQRGITELNRKVEDGLVQASHGTVMSGEESRRRSRAVRSKLSRPA